MRHPFDRPGFEWQPFDHREFDELGCGAAATKSPMKDPYGRGPSKAIGWPYAAR
jgi:hypothetical protein